jgi:hypothetical protein
LALHPLGLAPGVEEGPREWGRDDGVPGAAKNTGEGARAIETWLFENRIRQLRSSPRKMG